MMNASAFTLHLHCNHHSYLIPKSSSINAALSKSRRNPTTRRELKLKSSDVAFRVGFSRMAVLGGISLGVAVLLMGYDEHSKALALGPEGPLMEEFWDNMRRYALYALTVSTGAIYTLLQPIVELLKNPLSALVVLLILGGGVFIVSQVVTAMVGLSDFSYDYGY